MKSFLIICFVGLTSITVLPKQAVDVHRSSTNAQHEGMVFIKGGKFSMGCADKTGRPDEYPLHTVKVDGFWMDVNEVTNQQFKLFVDATGYVTTAERQTEWEVLKKQLPTGAIKPADSNFLPSSLVFFQPKNNVNLPKNNSGSGIGSLLLYFFILMVATMSLIKKILIFKIQI